MRILIDARVIQDHFPGIGRYVYNLVDAMAPQWHGELVLLVAAHAVNTRYDLKHLARHANVLLVPTDIPVFHWRSQTTLPGLIRSLGPQVVHFAYNVRPLVLGLPSVLTLYDVIPRRFPHYFARTARWKIEGIQRAALRASHALVAISQSTADDFVTLYHVPRQRVTVAPLAPDPVFHPRPQAEMAAFRRRMGLPERYFLYLGSNKPHKNLPRLIRAFGESQKLKGAGPKNVLVVAGHWDERYPEAKAMAVSLGLADGVRFLGPVSGHDLPLLYAASWAFVFPSQYEGFGLPVLEAMASGVPVACSRAPGLSEVAGQAALGFDANSVAEMADVLFRLGTDVSGRAQLIRLGTTRAQHFSWQETARLTLAVYERLARA